jgi:hypothetical protein
MNDQERERERRSGLEAPRPAPAAPERSGPEGLAEKVGNRGFGQVIARMKEGEGLLPGDRVHPDVEATIAATRGRGKPVAPHVADKLESAFGEPVPDVRVHTDENAAALARSVSARAFTVGNDIYFGEGEYRPETAAGMELMKHEAHHTRQQRDAPATGPLTVSQPGDALEAEAEDVARRPVT